MTSQLFPMILFGIATAFSPGPNNIMTSYTAFNFGVKKGQDQLKEEFNALMQKASDDMLKLAKAIDTADDLRAIQKELMWSNCSACHNRFRAEH